jgi:hypothetical protein
VGKSVNPTDLRRRVTSYEVKEHGGASAHPHDRLVEDGRRRNSLTPMSSWAAQMAVAELHTEGEKK